MLRRSRLLATVPALAAVALASACGGDDSAGDDGLPIVASTTIVADMVENVGGEDVDVTTLVGRESDAHAFEPEPSDSVAIADAALVFEVGKGFEPWLEEAVSAAGGDARVISLADGVQTTASLQDDPHVWLTAENGVVMAKAVTDALATTDPDNADAYRQRGEAYVEEIEAAGAEVEETLAAVPRNRRVLFTSHDAFGHFATEHVFDLLGSALNSVTTAGAEPSAAELAAVVAEIEASGAVAIFPENVASSATVETIAREAGVAVGAPLATGALGAEGSDADSYIGLLTSNAEIIAEQLGTGS